MRYRTHVQNVPARGRFTPTPRQRRTMDRHDTDDLALLAAFDHRMQDLGFVFLGVFGQGRSKGWEVYISRYHDVPLGHMIAAELA
jgi:hypothetical protein